MMRRIALTVLFSASLLVAPAWSTSTLRRGLSLDDSKKCPANQQYLPDVQFGCPASCDQPIPLCKAAIGPGCGCPKGTVIAGSTTRPHQPERCINPKKCRNKPPPKCVITGCNSEVCTDNPDIVTICIAPTCEVSCLTKFGTCQSDKTGVCGWDTSAAEQDYQHCLAGCEQPDDY
jgi:hypothetical protein